mmetsp:Transcript_21524/g.59085  ORF Transcript_21524/g.59085 Transcript_21524/m.59085 type:complete len:334 (+) Transcript_21524:210-1211(+)|eukprot:CAMPEP_0113672258 /NCGR_PEP_ID=MMETSP0038_2-20120614/6159_1 /TAXON_ID=2898 /ORGANISM="Cryptomonas paramecium" /LENGTH=333 /DNA_ID=CAMNT_0000588499 /DNA_START=220 /DNA_END=1221 /DNA_ORIENTATION=- /assembly_acc=CAM_ASM_000170
MERAKRASLGQQPFGVPDESALSLKILVSNRLVGGVIGKGGATINAIKEASGAKVKVSNNTEVFPGTTDRIILLSGSLNSILAAARMVAAEMFKETPRDTPEAAAAPFTEITTSVTIAIPSSACGLILGKGGERINLLREQTQAKITLQSKEKAVPGLNERTVAITGNVVTAQLALEKVILSLLGDGNVQYENLGTNYAGFTAITQSFAQVPQQTHAGLHAAALQLPLGYDFAAAYGLQQAAPQLFPGIEGGAGQVQMRLGIPEASVGVLVGKAGMAIKELMSISGASIKVSQRGEVVPGTTNRIVTISGNPVAANYAHMLVLQKVPTATPIT